MYVVSHNTKCQYHNFVKKKIHFEFIAGLPQFGKNVWKIKEFPDQGTVWEFWFQSGKCRKNQVQYIKGDKIINAVTEVKKAITVTKTLLLVLNRSLEFLELSLECVHCPLRNLFLYFT